MKLLVGYDGSACADQAIQQLTRAGLPPEGDAVVLSVADMWPILPDPEQELVDTRLPPDQAHLWEEQLRAAEGSSLPSAVRHAREYALGSMEEKREQAASGAALLQRIIPGWRVRGEAVADSPPWGLTKFAESWGADLVVVGSHGRSALARAFLGSVSTSVVSHSRCSVRIARCNFEPPAGPVRLLIGVDGTPWADVVTDAVARRWWPEGTQARILAVSEAKTLSYFVSHSLYSSGESASAGDESQWLTSRAEVAAERLRVLGIEVRARSVRGDPKRLLLQEAEEWGADCLIVGAKGQSDKHELVLGTVANAVVTRAHCSVEVVR